MVREDHAICRTYRFGLFHHSSIGRQHLALAGGVRDKGWSAFWKGNFKFPRRAPSVQNWFQLSRRTGPSPAKLIALRNRYALER